MTKEDAAAELNGCEYGREGSADLFARMRASGLVAVFGYSDDVAELRGAIDEELGASPFLVTQKGLLVSECDEGEECPYFQQLAKLATKVTPKEDPEGVYTHLYETSIPHAAFEVVEDGEPFCRGIAFALADAPVRAAVVMADD